MKSASKSSKKPTATVMANPVPEAESERRLRPVMDALYNHNTKQALKLVHQALQKRPGWPAARALRACIYIQADRWEEAARDMAQLRADLDAEIVPLDEDAAKKMHMYYHEIREDASSAEVYEAAWRANPTQLRLADHAFGYYIRGDRFSDAQKLATRLNRLAGPSNHKYAVMAAAALWLGLTVRARESPQSSAPPDALMLKLGCAMLTKALSARDAAPSAETLRFAVRVFKDAADYDGAERLATLPNLIIDEAELLVMRADIAFLRDRDPTHYRTLLTRYNPNDWGHWLRLFDCMSKSPNWIPDAHAFIEEVTSAGGAASAGEPPRGPLLARLELHLRADDMDALGKSLVEYFDKFGKKLVCSRDLRPYVTILRNKAPDMLDELFKNFTEVAERNGSAHYLILSWLRLWVGRLTDTPEQLMKRFYDTVIESLAPTERQPGDDFVIIAAHQLLPDLPADSSADDERQGSNPRYRDTAAVVKAVTILEAALTYSPFNVEFKLLLIHLYIELGGIERVAELWTSLDVKHVQLSTMTHLVLRPFFETGHHEALRTLLDGVEGLWRECDREIPECTSRAFMSGSTNAAAEFVLFRMRLSRSVVLAEAMLVESLLHVIAAEGEPIGMQRAMMTLTWQPRFTLPDFAEARSLISNDDTQALRLWQVAAYNPDCRLESMTEDMLEEGVQCTPARKQSLADDLASLVAMLSVGEEEGEVEDEVLNTVAAHGTAKQADGGSSNGHASQRPRPASKLRVDISHNILEVEQLLSRFAPANGTQVKRTDYDAANGEKIVATAKELTEEVVQMVNDIVKGGKTGDAADAQEDGQACMSPRRLRECSKATYETVLVVSMAVTALGPALARGQRRVKKDASGAHALDSARETVLTYRSALLAACTAIHEWFAAGVDGETDWCAPIFESQLSALRDESQLLPDSVQVVDLENGSKVGETMGRDDFVNWVRERVTTGHTMTCSSLLETLRCITNRLKLSDF